ncbi:MAG: hypothetical protein HY701_13960 [Gemmatimonadetes bacterium]|nr:hypothetical protein [Gemmatimonadota bacterium]
MSNVPAVGAFALGIVIGWLVRYFVRRFSTFTPQVLGTVVSIMLGGAVVKFLEADKVVWWFYPIGLLAGFIIYTALAIWLLTRDRSRRNGARLEDALFGPGRKP